MRKRLTSKNAAGSLRREISDDFKYDKKKLKHLHRILHNVNVALGTLGSALGEFGKVKGPMISPDGLLGGLGYVMPLKDIKEIINTSIHKLSDVADSLADEMSNPHWNARDDKETKELIKEKEKVEEETQEVMDAPESEEGTEETAPEEIAPEAPESEAMVEEEQLSPEDVKTSKNIITASDTNKIFLDSVRENLVRFSSIGKKI
jgi:flagellar biosynthesis GTPase FlhF